MLIPIGARSRDTRIDNHHYILTRQKYNPVVGGVSFLGKDGDATDAFHSICTPQGFFASGSSPDLGFPSYRA
jgi:hypothetical protein